MSPNRQKWGASAASAAFVLWPHPERGPWKVTCHWANVDGYARLLGLAIEVQWGYRVDESLGPLSTLTATVLRDLPLDHVANLVLEKIRKEQKAFSADGSDATGRYVRGGKTGRRPLTLDDLVEVAEIYRFGGTKPTQAVANALGISPSAAAKRVSRARIAGLLETTTQGRAGGPGAAEPKARKPSMEKE